jgi:arylsulfatase A
MKLHPVLLAVFLTLFLYQLSASQRPNFIVIMLDDMGYEGLSCFGNPCFSTPELDRLAKEGMQLKDWYADAIASSPKQPGGWLDQK